MMLNTSFDGQIDSRVVENFFRALINSFFKILPIKEQGEKSLSVYMESLMVELLGCKSVVEAISYDSSYLTLIAILQYLIDEKDCQVKVVKREVFRAISICNKMIEKYAGGE